MKNICKRILAVGMSLIMAMSYTTLASAKESEEESDIVIYESNDENTGTVEMSLDNSVEQLTSIYSGVKENSLEQVVPVVLKDHGAYLYFSYGSNRPLIVSMYKDDVKVYSKYLMSTNNVVRNTQIILDGHSPSDSYWAPGHYILRVNFPTIPTQYAYCVIGSPVILD